MKSSPNTCEGIKAALKALYSPPMTDEESREYRRLIAREMARPKPSAGSRRNWSWTNDFPPPASRRSHARRTA